MKKIIMVGVLGSLLAISGFTGEVRNRENRQQDRIAQGVRSGQLTARETAHLEGREAHLNREIRHDRREDHGHLTAADHRQINRQQNHLSRAIYRDKHDAARR
jgi:hypothetical protein